MARISTKTGNETTEIIDISLLLIGLDKIKQEANFNLGENEELKKELNSKIDSIVTEKEIKTVNEKIDDLSRIISKNPEIGSDKEIGVIAKRIELATEELVRQHPEEARELKKGVFQKEFEKEIEKANPNLKDEEKKGVKEYIELVAENSFGENILDGQENAALEANNHLFSPGRLENAWTDLKSTINFLQKTPQEIEAIKNKYNSIKEVLKDVDLPGGFKESRSFEKMMAVFNNSNSNKLFSKTRKYLGWADRVDKLTGGWLKKTVTKGGMKMVSKIGNQAIQEFAKNALNTIAEQGFQKGFTTVLNGVLSGGVNAATTVGTTAGTAAAAGGTAAAGTAAAGAAGTTAAAGTAAAGAATATTAAAGGTAAAGTAAAGAATTAAAAGLSATGWGAIVVAAAAALKVVKDVADKLAEKLGISSKKFLEENFGKIGGKILGGIATLIALPALLTTILTTTLLAPFLVVVFGVTYLYQMTIGNLISSLVPPKGSAPYEEVIDGNNEDIDYDNITYSGSGRTVGYYTWNGITFYVFEGANGDNIKQADRYDIDPSWLELIPEEYRKNCIYNGTGLSACQLDKRVIPAYIAMIQAFRSSGGLSNCQKNGDLKLNWGYRSKQEQEDLWYSKVDDYPSDDVHKKWAAPPWSISEHRTGRAMDIVINCGVGGPRSENYPLYRASATYKWLLLNAEKYGFYNYEAEPWHWSYNPPMPSIEANPDINTL